MLKNYKPLKQFSTALFNNLLNIIVMLRLIFDNTKKIKDFAKSFNPVEEKGKEQQIFNVGDVVTATEKSRYRFNEGTICDVYENNGYFYYTIKENDLTFRQKDIKKL